MTRRRLCMYGTVLVVGVAALALWRGHSPSSFLEPDLRVHHAGVGEKTAGGHSGQHSKSPSFRGHSPSSFLEPDLKVDHARVGEKTAERHSSQHSKKPSFPLQQHKSMDYDYDEEEPMMVADDKSSGKELFEKKIPKVTRKFGSHPSNLPAVNIEDRSLYTHVPTRKNKTRNNQLGASKLRNRFRPLSNSTSTGRFRKLRKENIKQPGISKLHPSRHPKLSVHAFRDTTLSWESRVEDLVARLTLDEKVGQMAHGGAENNGPAPPITRLGIKPYQWGTECISGNVWAGPATSFPMALGMSATFNYNLVYKVAMATSIEVRAANNDYVSRDVYDFHTGLSCWSPVVNIMRDPRWGRNQETYGEDPWLSGYLARAFVTGLQGNHSRYVRVNAGCKHFDAHGGPENGRYSFDAKVSERDWRMTFLPQFRACVEAGSWSIMCSYNQINGVPACANKKLLTDILRKEWHFKGYVVSDQEALEHILNSHHYASSMVEAATVAVNAGTCLEDGGKWDNVFSHIGEAVRKGMIRNATITDAVRRLFMVRMRLGEFDPPGMNPYKRLNVSDFVQSDGHRKLSLQAALESFVLLKNDKARGLPLTTPAQTACIVGPFIDNPPATFGFYVPRIMKDYVVTPLQGIKGESKIVGRDSIKSASGCKDAFCKSYNSNEVVNACSEAELAIVCLGTGPSVETEHLDRSDINLPGNQLQLLKDAVNSTQGRVVLVLYNGGPVDITWAKQSKKVVAIVENFFPAQSAGTALAMILTGKYNPAGRLPFTWPASLDQVPPISNYSMVNRTYRYFSAEPLYPFGFGLSYTEFKYSNISAVMYRTGTVKTRMSITVRVSVTNKGRFNGDEVVQVYISWPEQYRAIAPIRQLVGVKRVHIKRKRTINLKFVITSKQLQLYTERWEVVPGVMQVYVGGQQPMQKNSAPSNVLKSTFTISS